MPSDDLTPPFTKSSYPELKLPEKWESSIPEHLLEGADPQTLFIMKELSKNTQAIEWACHGLIDTNSQVRRTNGRLLQAESDIRKDRYVIESLNEKATVLEPLFKPVSQFMGLWDYRLFRYGCYIVIFFLITYALPWYLSKPFNISSLLSLFFGV